MNLETLISSNAVINDQEIKSKKRALESLAEILTEEANRSNQLLPDSHSEDDENSETIIDTLDIFQLLTEREKLGSTGMGHGVALPHARTNLTKKAIGAFLKLENGIDFDSPDQQPTDLIFALLVPEHFTDEHLKILSYLATLFSDEKFCIATRKSVSNEEIYLNLINWKLVPQVS